MRPSTPPPPAPGTRATRRGRLLVPVAALVLLAAVGVGLWARGGRAAGGRAPVAGARLLPEVGEPISEWVLFLGNREHAVFLPTQAELIQKADPRIRFRVLHARPGTRAALEAELRDRGVTDLSRITWQESGFPIPPWARDYMLLGRWPDGRRAIYLQHPEHYAEMLCGEPDGCGETYDAMLAFAGRDAIRTAVRLEGGEVVADVDRAFMSEAAIAEALDRGEADSEEAMVRDLERLWGLPVEVMHLGAEPPHHVDLYLSPAGAHRMVLGSPRLALELLARATPSERAAFARQVAALARDVGSDGALGVLQGVDLLGLLERENASPVRLAAFAGVRARLEALGYEVHEVPLLVLDARDRGVPVTFSGANVVQDVRDGRSVVYLPTCRLPPLDRAAAATWRSLGYDVVPVDALGPALEGGGLHCLSQAFRRPLQPQRP